MLISSDSGRTRWGWNLDPQGRLIWLETVAVFLGGFLALRVSSDLLATNFPNSIWMAFYSLIGQWLLLLTIFWPIVRGMSFQRWRQDMGWNRGEGYIREAGAGFMLYFASLPILAILFFLIFRIMIWAESMGWDVVPDSEDNKIIDLASSGNPLVLLLVFLLATIWAPVVEESIFRGALYRHTRWRFSAVLSGVLTAIVFAIMHNYPPLMLIMICALGMLFAVMREWRGSIIGSMVAHFFHNFIVLTFAAILFGQLAS